MSSLGCVCIARCAPRFDHGVFVPLMLALPAADIPIVCISLHSSLSAKVHVQVGQALAPLRSRGVIILGSGYSFHNMRGWFQPTKEILTENGIGIKSNVIFDSTKTKLIYATHNSLHVYNLLAKN